MIEQNRFNTLLDEIFLRLSTKSISDEAEPFDCYISSTLFEPRRSIDAYVNKLAKDIVSDNSQCIMRLHLKAESLGHYEMKILRECLEFSSGPIIIRSGAGSGKSSLLRYLESYCSNISSRLPLSKHKDIGNFFNVIDLIDLPQRFQISADDSIDKSLYAEFLEHLFKLSMSKLKQNICANDNVTDFDGRLGEHLYKLLYATTNRISDPRHKLYSDTVSYTHLTLPTNREV